MCDRRAFGAKFKDVKQVGLPCARAARARAPKLSSRGNARGVVRPSSRGDAAANTASGDCREGAPSGRGRPVLGRLVVTVTCSPAGVGARMAGARRVNAFLCDFPRAFFLARSVSY